MKFISAASVLLYAVVVAAGGNVIDLTPKNFDEIITNSGRPALVKFFAVSIPCIYSLICIIRVCMY